MPPPVQLERRGSPRQAHLTALQTPENWVQIGFKMGLFGFKWVRFLSSKSSFRIGKNQVIIAF